MTHKNQKALFRDSIPPLALAALDSESRASTDFQPPPPRRHFIYLMMLVEGVLEKSIRAPSPARSRPPSPAGRAALRVTRRVRGGPGPSATCPRGHSREAASSAELGPPSPPPKGPSQKLRRCPLPEPPWAPGGAGSGGSGVPWPGLGSGALGVSVPACARSPWARAAVPGGAAGREPLPRIPAEPRGHPCCPADPPHGRAGTLGSPGAGAGHGAEPPPRPPRSPALIPGAAPGWEAMEREWGGCRAGAFRGEGAGPGDSPV